MIFVHITMISIQSIVCVLKQHLLIVAEIIIIGDLCNRLNKI